jgi:hypothetical protein
MMRSVEHCKAGRRAFLREVSGAVIINDHKVSKKNIVYKNGYIQSRKA